MAGLFGGKASLVGDMGGEGLTFRERAMAAMAALNGDMATAMRIRQAPAHHKQQQAALDAITARLDPTYQDGPPVQVSQPAGLFGGQAAGLDTIPTPGALQPPVEAPQAPGAYQLPQRTSDPLSMNSPDLAKLAMQADTAGVPIASLLAVLKGQQPEVHYDRGFGYNQKNGLPMGQFHPELDKGQTLTPGGSVANLPGAVQAAAQMAGGVEGAKSAAQAPYQAVQTYDDKGRPMTINALTLAGGANGKGAPFVGQSPAQTAADTATATAGAQADINLPQTLASANQAIGLIEQMKLHPGLDSRVGWRGALPALPGTPGADFQAMQDQLKGKLFLEAYGQLKGGGQITEVEGKKATDAIARLSNTQTKAGYVKALGDLEDVINAGASRAAGQVQRLRPNASPAKAPALAGVPVADRMAEARRRGLIQ
jgi:hypothetical protein